MRQFSVWINNGDTEPKTMYRIARALGMSPTKHVQDILLEMVIEGKLTCEARDQKGRWTTRFFQVNQTSEHYHGKYGKRRIIVKHNGKIAGQLELFSRESESGWHDDYERDLRERARSTTGENLAREQYMDVHP